MSNLNQLSIGKEEGSSPLSSGGSKCSLNTPHGFHNFAWQAPELAVSPCKLDSFFLCFLVNDETRIEA